MRHLVKLPAFASFVKVPELDVVLRLVAFEQAFLLESVEKVDFPVQTARVSHLMLLLHLSVDLLDHIKVVPNALIVLHDHLITLKGPFQLQINLVSQGTHVKYLSRYLTSRVMNRLFNRVNCLSRLTQLDAGECQPVVSVRPVLAHLNRFLELLFGQGMLIVFLIVARQVED